MTVGANRSACSNLGPVQLNNGGTLYPAQSLNYNNIAIPDTDFGTISNFVFNDGIRPLNFTIMGCFTLGMPVQGGNNNDYDMIMIQDSEGLYADMQYNDNSGSPVVRIENHSVAHSSNISVEAGGTYFMSLNWNTSAATATLTIYTAQGALVGQSSVSDPSSGSGVTNVRLPSNENGTDSGTTYYQNIMMNWTTAPETLFWTSDSGTVQPPSGLSATVSVQ